MFVQRKIESDASWAEESKKLRTAESGGADDEAGPVMHEGSEALVDTGRDAAGTATSGSTGADTADENHMSVDIPVEETTTAEPTMDADLPAYATQPASTPSDVIDVDAIDTETSCDEAEKDKCVSNPLELGLDEYYLQPAGDDQPAGDVIDVDAETTPAATSSAAAILEETSHENQTSEVQTTGDDKSDLGGRLARANATGVEVRSIKPASGSSSLSSVREIQLVVHPSTEHDGMGAADVDQVVMDVADTVTEVVDRAVDSRETSSDEVIAIHGQVFIETEAAVTNTDVTCPQAAVEREVETATVPRTAPVQDMSSLGDNDEPTTKPVQDECREGNISRDEGMALDNSESGVAQASTDEDATLEIKEQSVDVTEDRDVTDGAGFVGDGAAQVMVDSTAEARELQSIVTGTDEVQQTADDVNQPTEPIAEADVSQDAIEKPVQPVNAEENYEEVKVGRSETDLAEPANEERTSIQETEQATVKASSDNYTSELTEMTDKQVSETEEKSQSMGVVVMDEYTKESAEAVVSDAHTGNIEIGKPHPQLLLAATMMDATEDRVMTDKAGSDVETITQLVTIAADESGKLPDIVSGTEEIGQTAGDVNQPMETMGEADGSLPGDVTAITAITSEECMMQHKDVPDVVETSRQPVEIIAETNNGEDVSGCKEMKDVAVADEEDGQQHADMTDSVKNDVALSNEIETDAVLEKRANLTAEGRATVLAAGDDGCNEQDTDVMVNVETAAETTQLTLSRDSNALTKHSGKTTGTDTTSMELNTGDHRPTAGELAGKSEDMQITVGPPTSAGDAAQ